MFTHDFKCYGKEEIPLLLNCWRQMLWIILNKLQVGIYKQKKNEVRIQEGHMENQIWIE